MSKIYRRIWNATARLWQVAGELGRQGRKRTGGRRLVAAGSLYLLPLAALGGELPSGGTVVTGVGSIEQFDKHLSITQGSERLAIEWQQFNIGAGNRVSFNQPSASAIALNRVIGTDGSRIMGQLDANGRVFLINPNGVLFGKNAQVDVGGLVASTLDISNEDFAAGNYRFRGNGNNAAIINKGHITAADGGAVALLGGHVSNEGVISARLGSVALVAGEQVTLDFAGDGLLKVQIDEATRDALVENHQLIQADGGQVLMSAHAADALLQTVVNNTGVIEARTLENRNGKIVLLGGFEGGTVEVAGKLDASAPEGGDGGFIDTSGAHVQIHEGLEVTTLAVDGRTGDWLIDPTDLTISAGSAAQNASGIGAETLSANLENNNVTLQTVAEGSEAGNIYVNGEVSWDAATTLTLSAHGDIHINQNISATTGKLALEYGQADVAAGNTADYHVNARVNLSAGQNFSTRLGSDGDVLEYTVITELGAEGSTSGTDLQGMQGNLNGLYALGADINASATVSWDGGAGFNPIGDSSNGFTGVFDGLGHLITGLTINRPSQNDVGLFGHTNGAWLRNIGLQRGSVVGKENVGSLVGKNQGAISQSWASVAVNGAMSVGGLVGWNTGWSGWSTNGTINESYAVGPVSGSNREVGGLVGYNAWQISNSYATGVVSGNKYVGGLVGANYGTITNTYATGAVSGSDSVGGLVGGVGFSGDIAESYWNTETTGQISSAGGGTGWTTAELIEALPVGFDPEVWGNAGNQTTPYLLGLSGNQVFSKNDLPSGTISASNRPVLYTVIQDVHQLQAMKDALGERYVLGNDINASATVSWNGGAGFAPIKTFNGTLDGLGYAIHGLTIYRPSADEVGLFGVTGDTAVLRNIRLEDINVTGRNQVGGLVGRSGGSIENAHTSGTVSGNRQVGGLVGQAWLNSEITGSSSLADVSGKGDRIGGLVGEAYYLVTIEYSHAGGAVSGNGNGDDVGVGGLVGYLDSASNITRSHATGDVRGNQHGVGGLVGYARGVITDSYATGDVSGKDLVGGLVGWQKATSITGSHASGGVSGVYRVGGLVGYREGGEVVGSHASGTVTGKGAIGGLVGYSFSGDGVIDSWASGDVTSLASGSSVSEHIGGLIGYNDGVALVLRSFATGTVRGSNTYYGEAVGGLVGWNRGSATIEQSYATGAVFGAGAGGLVGVNEGTIRQSYASGWVDGNGGGLIYNDYGGSVIDSYWDMEASGQSSSHGGTGLTSAQMRELASFAGWSIDDQGGTDSVWRIYEGHTAPLLRAFLTPFEVDVDAVTTTYNGGNHRALNSDQLSYDTPTLDLFTGELGYLASSRNVGTYSGADLRLVGLYSSQQGYDIIANGELTINPAELTITSTDVIKTYDGSTGAAGTAHVMAGALYGTDTLSGGVFTFTDKNVGIGNKTVTVSDVTVEDGNGGANYTVTYEDNTTSTINPFVINLSGSRVYDGGVDVEADVLTLGSLVGDETLSLSGTGFMADKHVGDGKVFQLGSLSLGDGDQGGLASNYTLEGGSHSVTITPAQLHISTSDII
ncbi:filamentous hemagglutinin family N-terminal domain-containing protein, partial [Halopseudomonas formosensis]